MVDVAKMLAAVILFTISHHPDTKSTTVSAKEKSVFDAAADYLLKMLK